MGAPAKEVKPSSRNLNQQWQHDKNKILRKQIENKKYEGCWLGVEFVSQAHFSWAFFVSFESL